jgi:hypothetical protein
MKERDISRDEIRNFFKGWSIDDNVSNNLLDYLWLNDYADIDWDIFIEKLADKITEVSLNSPAQWEEEVDCEDCGGSGRRKLYYNQHIRLMEWDKDGNKRQKTERCPSCTDGKVKRTIGVFVREECGNCRGSGCYPIGACEQSGGVLEVDHHSPCPKCVEGYIYRQLTLQEILSEVETDVIFDIKSVDIAGKMYDMPRNMKAIQTFHGKEVVRREVLETT